MLSFSEVKAILLGEQQYIAYREIGSDKKKPLGDAGATAYGMALKYMSKYKGFEETYHD